MRRASKVLITMLTLTVLFAIYAISASAAGTGTATDPYTGEISADATWGDGTYVGAVTISGNTTITVDGTVNLLGTITVDSGANSVTLIGKEAGACIKAAEGFSGTTMIYAKKGTGGLNIENLTIDAVQTTFNSETKTLSSTATATLRCVATVYGSTLNLKDGTEIKGGFSLDVGGAGVYNEGTLNMYSGSAIRYCYTKITGKSSYQGGGAIMISSASKSSPNKTFNMYGGTIENNYADVNTSATYQGGGAIYSRAFVNISGGLIQNNKSSKNGGAIFSTGGPSAYPVTVDISGGTISGNTAATNGGAIANYANSTTKVSETACINENTAKSNGGGIYNTNILEITGGTITKNHSDSNGGGVFSYTSATTTITGGSITQNTTASSNNNGVHTSGGTLALSSAADISGNTTTAGKERNVIFNGDTILHFTIVYDEKNDTDISNWAKYNFDKASTTALATVPANSTRNNPGSLTLRIDGEVAASNSIIIPKDSNVIIAGDTSDNVADKLTWTEATGNGCIEVSGTLTVKDVTLDANSKNRVLYVSSGGVANIESGATLTGGYGAAGKGGAGVINYGNLNISGGTITGNMTTDEIGGGIYSKGTVTISGNAVITNNHVNKIVSNVGVWGTGIVKIETGFTGTIGLAADEKAFSTTEWTSEIINGGTATEAELTALINSKNIVADNAERYALVQDGTVVSLKSIVKEITIASPNGDIKVTVAQADRYNTLPEYDDLIAPEGYSEDNFVGFIKVKGYGSDAPVAEAIYEAGEALEYDCTALGKVYVPVWAKVETIGAAAKIGENSGLMFATKVDVAALENIGINVKGYVEDDTSDGFYRGMLLGTKAKTGELTIENTVLNKQAAGTEWLGSEWYKAQGKTLEEGTEVFTLALTYNNSANYNKVVTYRGYIAVTIGGEEKILYADYSAPETLEDGDLNTLDDGKNARTARAVIRNQIFESGKYGTLDALNAAFGTNAQVAMDIAAVEWDGAHWLKTDVVGTEKQYAYWDGASWVVIEQQEETIEPEDSDASVDAE